MKKVIFILTATIFILACQKTVEPKQKEEIKTEAEDDGANESFGCPDSQLLTCCNPIHYNNGMYSCDVYPYKHCPPKHTH